MMNLKLSHILNISWLLAFVPFCLLLILISYQLYLYIYDVQESHPRFYKYLRLQLFFCFILFLAGIAFVGMYLDLPPSERDMLFIKMLPLYGVILIISSVFIYLLPGFCDPENNTEKRIPFLILSYLLMTLAFMVLLNINEKILLSINGYLLYAPILCALVSHIITIVPYFGQRSYELVLVILLLAEFELFVLI